MNGRREDASGEYAAEDSGIWPRHLPNRPTDYLLITGQLIAGKAQREAGLGNWKWTSLLLGDPFSRSREVSQQDISGARG